MVVPETPSLMVTGFSRLEVTAHGVTALLENQNGIRIVDDPQGIRGRGKPVRSSTSTENRETDEKNEETESAVQIHCVPPLGVLA